MSKDPHLWLALAFVFSLPTGTIRKSSCLTFFIRSIALSAHTNKPLNTSKKEENGFPWKVHFVTPKPVL